MIVALFATAVFGFAVFMFSMFIAAIFDDSKSKDSGVDEVATFGAIALFLGLCGYHLSLWWPQ